MASEPEFHASDERVRALWFELIDFLDHELIPAEARYSGAAPWERPGVVADLQAEACRRRLWRLTVAGAVDRHPAAAALSPSEQASFAAALGRSRLGRIVCGCD